MQDNDSHDEEVEIVDLDTPDSALSRWQHHILHTTRRLLAEAPARSNIMALALLCSVVVLFTLLQSSLHIVPLGIAHPTPTAAATPLDTSFTMSAANGTVYIAGSDGSLTAYRALDGARRWQIKSSQQRVYSSSVSSGQAVYAILTLGKEARIEARQSSNGRSMWMSQTLPFVSTSLTVRGGVVYARTQEGIIYAFDALTGKELWHFDSGQSLPDAFFFVEENSAIIPAKGNIVYVLQARSGKMLLHFHPDSQGSLWYQEDNGIFYYAADSEPLQAFSLSTGKLLWQDTQAGYTIGSLTAYNGVLYIGIRDGGMTALRGQDGKLLWHNSAIAAGSSINFPIDNKTLYVSAENDDTLVGIRASDGKQLWQRKIDGLSLYAHWIDSRNDALYLLQRDNSPFTKEQDSIQERDISTGKLLWHFTLSSPIGSPGGGSIFSALNGIICLQLSNGTMDVIRLSDGKLLWHL